MKNALRILALLAAAIVAVASVAVVGEGAGAALPEIEDCFTERDLSGEWPAATATAIELTGDTAECASHVVSVEGGTVTILDGGVYALSGTLDDGRIVVDVKDDERVQLVLNGANITSSDSAAIRVVQADKVFITLADGTENALESLAFSGGDGAGAVIYSDEDLTFNGTGSLTITSPAGDGIDGKDDAKFASGTYVITVSGRGVDANDSVRIAGGSFTIASGSDAIRARHRSNAALGYVTIWGGAFTITSGGGAAEAVPHSDAGFGGFDGGNGGQMGGHSFRDGEEAAGTDEAFPERDEFTAGNGESFERPDFSGGDGALPEFPGDMPEGFDPSQLEMPEDFDPSQMEMPEGFDPSQGGEAPGATVSAASSTSAKGIRASGDLTILGGSFAIDAADDALHTDSNLTVAGGSFGISTGDDALHADGRLAILNGSIDIAWSYEGLEGEVIELSGGSVRLTASDDGLNASGDQGEGDDIFASQAGVAIRISGGTLYVNAEGDGIDSNGDLSITGGTIVVSGPSNGANGALDYNGTAVITGGTIVAAGASGMAQNFSGASTQPAFLVSLNGQAGEIAVTDANGAVVLSAEVEKGFATVVVSSPDLEVGETYTVSCGDTSAEITLTDTVTGSDSGGMCTRGGGGMGGQHMRGARDDAQGDARLDDAHLDSVRPDSVRPDDVRQIGGASTETEESA